MRRFVNSITQIRFNPVIYEYMKTLPYDAEYHILGYLRGCWGDIDYNWNQRRIFFK